VNFVEQSQNLVWCGIPHPRNPRIELKINCQQNSWEKPCSRLWTCLMQMRLNNLAILCIYADLAKNIGDNLDKLVNIIN